MFKFLIGLIAGFFAGFLMGFIFPIEFFIIACIVLIALAAVLFYVFHLGLRDFQEY